MRKIAILGATGSIGTQALDVIRRYPERFSVVALTARENSEKLFALAREFRPAVAGLVVPPEQIPADLAHIEWLFGDAVSERALKAAQPDDALCAVVGIAGLGAVLTALDVCERVLLANKEALVTGGELVMGKAARLHKALLPVDSEHSAIFQCLQAAGLNEAEKIIITCSGGALRTWDAQKIAHATVADVLRHPTWKMGGKITVDCATLMNKGLEVIEAHHLFAMPLERIEVVIHPESIIHSMVAFHDGAVLAQLGNPDMRGPIGYALGYPERLAYGGSAPDFARLGSLTFAVPDTERFPCLRLAVDAQRTGGSAPVILNGANEAAVALFLQGKIAFGQIAEAVAQALSSLPVEAIHTVEDVYQADAAARRVALEALRP